MLDELKNVFQNLDHFSSQFRDALRLKNTFEIVQIQIQNIEFKFQTWKKMFYKHDIEKWQSKQFSRI
jgi:hypothetical protein